MVIDGVEVENNGAFDDSEVKRCIALATKSLGSKPAEITLSPADKGVEIHYVVYRRKFERIRRITGYLVGTIDRWNNAKQSEEKERVKHGY